MQVAYPVVAPAKRRIARPAFAPNSARGRIASFTDGA